MPTMPVKAAGWRIEPPVSVPVAPRQSCAATAAAEPPDEPPGTSGVFAPLRRQGEITGPKNELSFDEPMANSSLLVLPSITAPSRQSCAVTVELVGRHEIVEDVRAGGGAHVLGREHVLDRERDAFERARIAGLAAARRPPSPSRARSVRRLQHIGVEGPRAFSIAARCASASSAAENSRLRSRSRASRERQRS